jgi:hypothetical protein
LAAGGHQNRQDFGEIDVDRQNVGKYRSRFCVLQVSILHSAKSKNGIRAGVTNSGIEGLVV